MASRTRQSTETLDAIATLAQLAGVDQGELAGFLAPRWQPGAEALAAARIDALRNAHARQAAAARRAQAKHPQRDVREVIDQKLQEAPRWSKKRAFAWLAGQRSVSADTIRNAYYARCLNRDDVITASRVCELVRPSSADDRSSPGELAALGR